MKRVAFGFALVLAFATLSLAGAERVDRGNRLPPHTIHMISPEVGQVLVPGEVVRIEWESNYPDVRPSQASPLYGETEIYLSLDGGATFPVRLTRQLSPTLRSFDWTVPNLPTDSAVLDIRHGYEEAEVEGHGGADAPAERETRHIQEDARFVIVRAPMTIQEVVVSCLPGEAAVGQTIPLSWRSSVDNVAAYEVLISTDHGDHFHPVVRTTETNASWKIPSDMIGRVVFLVAAERTDGSRVESVVRPAMATRIKTK